MVSHRPPTGTLPGPGDPLHMEPSSPPIPGGPQLERRSSRNQRDLITISDPDFEKLEQEEKLVKSQNKLWAEKNNATPGACTNTTDASKSWGRQSSEERMWEAVRVGSLSNDGHRNRQRPSHTSAQAPNPQLPVLRSVLANAGTNSSVPFWRMLANACPVPFWRMRFMWA